MAREFSTRSFNPVVKESQGGDFISQQMEEAIQKGTNNGWEFHSYQTVQVVVKPGCLAIFSGPRITNYGVIVFSREVPSIEAGRS